MIKIKLSCPPKKWNFQKYFPNHNFEWGDYKFFLNQDISECDYWFILGDLVDDFESVTVPINNTILHIQEVPEVIQYSKQYLNQFNYVSSYNSNINHSNFIKSGPVFPWFIERSFEESNNNNKFSKSKKLSIITSDKKITINHIKRLNFFKNLDKYFGNEIDIYGAGFSGFIKEKKTTLDPYMFSVVAENSSLPDYFTEKVGDCFLSHTFPLYHGCTNFNKYFNHKSFETIDINNFDQSVKIIKNILNDDNFYDSRLPSILESKNAYLHKFSIVPSICNIIDKIKYLEKNNSSQKKEVKLFKSKPVSILTKLQNKIIVKSYDLFH